MPRRDRAPSFARGRVLVSFAPMRLKKIKLAGFKSFVDPTTVHIPSNLVGVVGPNGCGKSNVIDAVRWVMGESSAKNLRGDSMTDVIFNGSTSRKPVGQASIELVFDNTENKLGGQYAQFNEISIKRLVSRDGQSNYYLNGARCRRRDITDIFLGTGLGPRSYSIIEQGMISRLVEAKPVELRVFFEEAAGISKYKERRRETENRMSHTRDNLDRLNDLREELDKQLHHLQRQARAAERYKELKQEERLLRAQLQALRWRSLDQAVGESEQAIRAADTRLEGEIARLRSVDTEMEKLRAAHTEAGDTLSEVQGRFYGLGADIARVEQAIQHNRERRAELDNDLKQAERVWQDLQHHLETDQRRIGEFEARLAELDPALEEAREAEEISALRLGEAEESMQTWQAEWDAFTESSSTPSQRAQVERTRIQHLEQRIHTYQHRLGRLDQERAALSPGDLELEIARLEAEQEKLDEEIEQLQARLSEVNGSITARREQNRHITAELDTARSRQQQLRGRHASLEALQQAALGKGSGAAAEWLHKQGLEGRQRLAEGLRVSEGWEPAVETVLGHNLQAVCVDGLAAVADALESLGKGRLTFFDTAMSAAGSGTARAGAVPLASLVRAPWPLESLLDGVHAVEDLAAALALHGELGPRESVITRDGIWLGRGWLRVSREQDEQAGVLAREQELERLEAELDRVSELTAELAESLEQGRETLRGLEEQRDTLQHDATQLSRRHADLRAQLSGRQARLEQFRSRLERIESEIGEGRDHIAQSEREVNEARGALEAALEAMAEHEARREAQVTRRDALRAQLQEARQRAAGDRDKVHQLALETRSLHTQVDSTRRGLERMEAQLEGLAERREALLRQLTECESPITELNRELEQLLDRRLEVEKELSAARAGLEGIEHQLRELESSRGGADQRVAEVRAELEQARMRWQELKVRRQTLEEQVIQGGFEVQPLLEELPETAAEAEWEQSLEQVNSRIQRLGPINLAAIDEYKVQSERKTYLDSQHADLTEALETLENAIRRIDRETRTRFRETFDKVNDGLKQMFPRLFGGGHAYLELTGEDVLDAGVSIMARPPGKRNSTIHLLSGGEKALTAVALVFSIFELNPAPFCMLDEVDAPLDDANVGRFCTMVKEMSERVQFVFITHNKTTMEMAQHLSGVTMQEPGVSRLVSVDVQEAVALVAS